MIRSAVVVVVVPVVFLWTPVAWEPVVLESVVRKFEEANFLVIVVFLVNWQVYL
jgi:hypothetical protein